MAKDHPARQLEPNRLPDNSPLGKLIATFGPAIGLQIASYQFALGAFVQTFATVESALAFALGREAGLTQEKANAILSGQRNVNTAIGLLGRLLDAKRRKGKRRQILDAALKQLGIINGVRNMILHHGFTINKKELRVSDKDAVHLRSRARTLTVSSETLGQMTEDLSLINMILLVHATGIPHGALRAYRQEINEPWQYKPPPQSSSPGKNRKPRRKQPTRPPSSPS